MEKSRVGSVEVIALVDLEAAYPATAVYPKAGDALGAYRDRLDGEGRVKLNFGCFLLRADGRGVLVDTGWGPENAGRLPVISTIDAEQPEWENSFDWDATIARATRLAVLERLEREGALVGASHLPAPGLGRFQRAEGRRSWRGL